MRKSTLRTKRRTLGSVGNTETRFCPRSWFPRKGPKPIPFMLNPVMLARVGRKGVSR